MRGRAPIPGFVLLHLRRGVARPLRVALAVLGIAAGTSLLVAMLGVHQSMVGSVERLARLVGDADLEVTAATDVGLDPAVVDGIAATDGVTSVAPIVRQDVVLDGDVVLLVAADERALAFGGVLGDELLPELAEVAPARGGTGPGLVLTLSLIHI